MKHAVIYFYHKIQIQAEKNMKQAVAELGQTQVKLEVIDEIVVEVRS